jgi:hypothetical protein
VDALVAALSIVVERLRSLSPRTPARLTVSAHSK